MTREQQIMRRAVFEDKAAVIKLIADISGWISGTASGGEIVKLRLLRIAVRAIAAARWGTDWQTA
jgi:hypothetical protein